MARSASRRRSSKEDPDLAPRGRTCAGCRRVRRKEDLVRLVATTDGGAALDPTGTAAGRGAYVCRDGACLERARRRLAGALRVKRIDFAEIKAGFSALMPGSKEYEVL